MIQVLSVECSRRQYFGFVQDGVSEVSKYRESSSVGSSFEHQSSGISSRVATYVVQFRFKVCSNGEFGDRIPVSGEECDTPYQKYGQRAAESQPRVKPSFSLSQG